MSSKCSKCGKIVDKKNKWYHITSTEKVMCENCITDMSLDLEKVEQQNYYFNRFFEEDIKDIKNKDNGELLTMLNDVVQVLALENNAQWVLNNNMAHKTYRKIYNEIYKRMS